MITNNHLLLDNEFHKCLINKAFAIEALPAQRELLYILTSGSSLIQILHTMMIYIDVYNVMQEKHYVLYVLVHLPLLTIMNFYVKMIVDMY
jgi:hypothetical protein